jgi:hypothetical protein
MSDGSERQFAAVDATWDAVERNDRARLNELADQFVHPDCEWTPLLAGVDGRTYRGPEGMVAFFGDWLDSFNPRYEDRRFEEVAENIILASCRLRVEGRESQVGIDREIALVAMFDDDGLLRRGRAYDSRAAAAEGARELLHA